MIKQKKRKVKKNEKNTNSSWEFNDVYNRFLC